MKTIDGFNYSKETLDDYTFRINVEVATNNDEYRSFNIYTNNPSKKSSEAMVRYILANKVKIVTIYRTFTKEDDDIHSEFVDMIINKS